jgi:hypothetical protein
MYSNIVPFTDVIQAVKDETGEKNLRNLYQMITRHVYRVEKDIGFGGGLILKKRKYQTADYSIVDSKIKLPFDLIKIEEVGTCQEGLTRQSYHHQGNYLFLTDPNITEFTLLYYTMLCDGEGNPVVTENHFDAVVAGIKFFMYQPKLWNGEGNMKYGQLLQVYYFDRVAEAIGNDVMPTTATEWAQIAQHLRMSYSDMLIYSEDNRCYEGAPVDCGPDFGSHRNDTAFHWQYDDTNTNISTADLIDQDFLNLQTAVVIPDFERGILIPYTNIGRIGFAIQEVAENAYKITDIFGSDLTNTVFDTYYNILLKTQVYISKDIYTHGNIYFKIEMT